MRLLCLSYEYPPLGGGGARVVEGLTNALAESDTQVDLITMGFRGLPADEVSPKRSIFRIPGIRMRQSVCSAAEMVPYAVSAISVAAKLVRANTYGLNHTHFIYPDGFISWNLKRQLGLRYVITAHGSDVPGYNPDRFKTIHSIAKPLWCKVTSGAERIICPSRSLETLVKESNPQAKTVVVPNGIDPQRFTPGCKSRSHVLVVTRMFPRKGLRYLVDGVAMSNLDVSLDIVGDGPNLQALKKYAESRAIKAKFHGALDNESTALAGLYARASIFVLPSEAENFPVSLLEAMSAGCSIVTTKGTGCEEVVGSAALLVPPRDAEALGNAVKRLIDNPLEARELGQKARVRLLENFSWKVVAAQYLRLYHDVTAL